MEPSNSNVFVTKPALHRSRGRRDRGGHRPPAGIEHERRHSDARFIASYCPVIEFGLVGQTMHQIDERTPVADLEKLTRIYRGVLDRYLDESALPPSSWRACPAIHVLLARAKQDVDAGTRPGMTSFKRSSHTNHSIPVIRQNQSHFPFSRPMLDVLLALDRSLNILVTLEVNQPLDGILFGNPATRPFRCS